MRSGEISDAVRHKELDLECTQMVLRQRGRRGQESRETYRGPGSIRQESDGRLAVKLFAVDVPKPVRGFGDLGMTPGELLTEEHYYDLVGIDVSGIRWSAERFQIDVTHASDRRRNRVIISGNPSQIACRECNPCEDDGAVLTGYIHRPLDFPCDTAVQVTESVGDVVLGRRTSFDEARFDSEGFSFRARRKEGAMSLCVASREEWPRHFSLRLLEALNFVLARSVSWDVLVTNDGRRTTCRIAPGSSEFERHKMPPPLGAERPWVRDYWRMFTLYLKFVMSHQENSIHPCSRRLYAARIAAAKTKDTEALGLCVAVEGLARDLYDDLIPRDEKLKKQLRTLGKAVKRQGLLRDWDPKTVDRLWSKAGSLLGVGAGDRLYDLARRGIVETEHVDAWKALRNPSAHGAAPGGGSLQGLVDNVSKVSTMMYHMIFYKIGYAGSYRDRSRRGYPLRSYPLASEGRPESRA